MKIIICNILLFLVYLNCTLSICCAMDRESLIFKNTYMTNLDIALELAKDKQQNVVLVCSASWCKFCNNLKEDLPTISGFDNKIICIIDIDEYKKISKKYRIKSLPTSIILKHNGQEISRITGYDKKKYEKWLEINK